MDNQRLIPWLALVAMLYLCYASWQQDYPSAPVQPPAAAATTAGTPAAPSALDEVPRVGAAPAAAPAATPAGAVAAVPAPGVAAASTDVGPIVHVRTDLLDLEVASRGAEIRSAKLLAFTKRKDDPTGFVQLLNDDSTGDLSLFQWGLATTGSDAEPNHKALFTAAASDYALKDGENELVVPLTWTNGAGVTVTRTLTLKRGSYAIALDQRIENAGTSAVTASDYERIERHWAHVEGSFWNRDPERTAFRGPVFFDGTKLTKLNVEKADAARPPTTPLAGGWAAAMQHYFVIALIPDAKTAQRYNLDVQGALFSFSVVGPQVSVAPGAQADFRSVLYLGPKLQATLASVAPKLDYTADYGWLTIIAQPLFKLLSLVQRVIGNWGFTIIIVTFLIKLCFYPLAQTSGRSMAKMRHLAPRMKAIQERYKDDREQLGKQMMELYKREKVNPLAGCLPIVVQIPVFIAFYQVLLESVELRQAPFLGWLSDLSTKDPYFILPVIMAAAMFGQFKLNPAPPDPVQAKVFAFMPLVMSATMAFFPSGLVLYWITNTTLSIAQQWRINKLVEAGDDKKTKG
jgi:YidC/Oxa1 family membrane protein insertase